MILVYGFVQYLKKMMNCNRCSIDMLKDVGLDTLRLTSRKTRLTIMSKLSHDLVYVDNLKLLNRHSGQ